MNITKPEKSDLRYLVPIPLAASLVFFILNNRCAAAIAQYPADL